MNLLLRGVWNFTETTLRLTPSKRPVHHAIACRGVAACPPCKTTQDVHVVRLKCRNLRSNLSSETVITVLLTVKVHLKMSRELFLFVFISRIVDVCQTQTLNHIWREKTNQMQQLDVYYYLLSQHVSGIIMPIFRRTKALLLHLVSCSGSAGCGW
jgi:hypothetical protein